MIEAQILAQVIGKERHGWARELGLGPTPTSYYGYSSSCGTTTSIGYSVECRDLIHQIDQRVKPMEEESEQEHAHYKPLLTFLQN